MSYSDFLDFISNGFTLFFDNIFRVANNLMTNYIFITLVGVVIFISLIHVIYDLIISLIIEHDGLDKYVKGGKL